MNYTSRHLILFVTVAALAACDNAEQQSDKDLRAPYNEIVKANWLIGQWGSISEEGSVSESWEKMNDSTYAGISYFIIGNDTVSYETISLEQRNNNLFYIPTVNEQNESKPVTFALTRATTEQLIFENPSHDFPQKISYTLVNKDSVLAEISGMMDGKPNAMRFPMKRK